ncbi:DUF1877 family protein [Catenulispora yoronensis]|uniref:DUF1877 family protein n=1 Tax=Catenulispora yoronensis TaxID=450799 RepID=UPI0031DA681F
MASIDAPTEVAAVEAVIADPDDLYDLHPERYVEIDAVWDCLDAILEPVRAIDGGELVAGIDDRDVLVLAVDEVAEIAEALARLDFGAALRRSREAVEELYGGAVEDEDEEEFRLLFDEVKAFYARAAADRAAVIKW